MSTALFAVILAISDFKIEILFIKLYGRYFDYFCVFLSDLFVKFKLHFCYNFITIVSKFDSLTDYRFPKFSTKYADFLSFNFILIPIKLFFYVINLEFMEFFAKKNCTKIRKFPYFRTVFCNPFYILTQLNDVFILSNNCFSRSLQLNKIICLSSAISDKVFKIFINLVSSQKTNASSNIIGTL